MSSVTTKKWSRMVKDVTTHVYVQMLAVRQRLNASAYDISPLRADYAAECEQAMQERWAREAASPRADG